MVAAIFLPQACSRHVWLFGLILIIYTVLVCCRQFCCSFYSSYALLVSGLDVEGQETGCGAGWLA